MGKCIRPFSSYSVCGTSAGFGKSSWRPSKSFPNLFIQSETSASTHEYPESNRASKCVMLLSNFESKNRGLSPVSEAGFRHQLVLVPRLYWKWMLKFLTNVTFIVNIRQDCDLQGTAVNRRDSWTPWRTHWRVQEKVLRVLSKKS